MIQNLLPGVELCNVLFANILSRGDVLCDKLYRSEFMVFALHFIVLPMIHRCRPVMPSPWNGAGPFLLSCRLCDAASIRWRKVQCHTQHEPMEKPRAIRSGLEQALLLAVLQHRPPAHPRNHPHQRCPDPQMIHPYRLPTPSDGKNEFIQTKFMHS